MVPACEGDIRDYRYPDRRHPLGEHETSTDSPRLVFPWRGRRGGRGLSHSRSLRGSGPAGIG